MFFRFREKKNPSHIKTHIPFFIFHIPSESETNVTNVRAPGGRRVQGDGLWSNWVLVCASMLPRPFLNAFQQCQMLPVPRLPCTGMHGSARLSGRDNQLVFAPMLLFYRMIKPTWNAYHLIDVLRCEIACSKSSSLQVLRVLVLPVLCRRSCIDCCRTAEADLEVRMLTGDLCILFEVSVSILHVSLRVCSSDTRVP